METGLQLLTTDGKIHVYFHPRLTSEQYAELMRIVERPATTAELSAAIREAGGRWEREVIIDG